MKQEQEKPIGPTAGPLGIPPPPSFHPINWDAYGRGQREYPVSFGTGDAPNAMPSPCPPWNYIWALCQGTCIKIQLRVLNTKTEAALQCCSTLTLFLLHNIFL